MNRVSIGFALIICCAASWTHAAEPSYQYSKSVSTGELKTQELLVFELDAEVYAATADDFVDLRMVDSQGKPVPFLLRRAQTTQPRTLHHYQPAEKPAVRPLPGGSLEITLTREIDGPPTDGLRIITPLKNFEQRLQVFVSATGDDWQTIGSESLIFDHSRYMDVRNVEVTFPRTEQRHFRIAIDSVTAEQQSELLELTRRLRGGQETEREEQVKISRRPFRIERVDFRQDVTQDHATGTQLREYTIQGFEVAQDDDERQTVVTVDTNREPLVSLQLQTTEHNFSRKASVQVEHKHGIRSTWQTIAESTLTRVDFKTMQREELLIAIPESRQQHFRILIHNRDSPPLPVAGIVAQGHVYEAVFLANPEIDYELQYSAKEATPADYDVAAIQTLLAEGFEPKRILLGDQQTRADAGPGVGMKPADVLNSPIVMLAVVSVLVVLLAWGLYSASRRVDVGLEE